MKNAVEILWKERANFKSGYLYCGFCGKWLPKEQAETGPKGRLRCPKCKHPLRIRGRYYRKNRERKEGFAVLTNF